MKLYDAPIAPNPRRVRWVMAEKAITDIEVVAMSMLEGDQKTPEFVAKVGLPLLPALELDDGTIIAESLAICRYLESLYPEPNLFGTTPLDTAIVEMWTRRAELMVGHPAMHSVRHTSPHLAVLENQDAAFGAHNIAQMLAGLEVLDRRLAEVEWLAGDRITMADIVAFIGIDFTRLIRLAIPEDLANLHRWLVAMRARPAASV
jgi:glutathione S-transferase